MTLDEERYRDGQIKGLTRALETLVNDPNDGKCWLENFVARMQTYRLDMVAREIWVMVISRENEPQTRTRENFVARLLQYNVALAKEIGASVWTPGIGAEPGEPPPYISRYINNVSCHIEDVQKKAEDELLPHRTADGLIQSIEAVIASLPGPRPEPRRSNFRQYPGPVR